jgi:undecaprenyl-diphosphatase
MGRREVVTLALLLVVAACVWAFAEIADEVMEGETRAFDRWALMLLRNEPADPVGPPWFEGMVRDITALGSWPVLLLVSLSVAGYLALQRRYRTVALLVAAVGGGQLGSTVLKLIFERERPDIVPGMATALSASFPSGHSMMAAVTYLTLAALLARVQSHPGHQTYLIVIAFLITVIVGISRIYMGMHWPTDVLAGWTAGLAWASLCWGVALLLQRRGILERQPAETETPEAETE